MVHTLSTRVPVIRVLNWRKKISAQMWYFPKLITFMASFLGQCFLADECTLPQKHVLPSFLLDVTLPNVFWRRYSKPFLMNLLLWPGIKLFEKCPKNLKGAQYMNRAWIITKGTNTSIEDSETGTNVMKHVIDDREK